MQDSSIESASARAAAALIVGRDAELAELRRSLSEALAGRGRLYLLSGEPGIGKTRLCDELGTVAEKLGVRVLWGRSWEAGGAPAYFPWLDILQALAETLDDASLAQALAEGATAVAELLPALRPRITHAEPSLPATPEEARFRLYRAVARLLRSAARGSGLLLVLEDLHAADEGSLLLLGFVARELRGARVLGLGTLRDVEAQLRPELREALAKLSREATNMALSRLAASDVEQMVHGFLHERGARIQQDLYARTQGNPLFVTEMLRLVQPGPQAEVTSALPAGIREVIGERLGRVAREARALLEVAAVSGDEVLPELVAEVVGASAPAVVEAFAHAVRAGVLVASGTSFRFAHALFREVLVAELGAERLAALHEALASALERRSRFSSDVPLERIAHHLLQAPASVAERAVEFALRAAERALQLFAFDAALELLERARGAVARAGAEPTLRGKILVALARARMSMGDRERGREACLEAAAIARESKNPDLLAQAALAYGLEITAALVNPALVALLQEALDALPVGDTPLRIAVAARLAAAMQPCADLQHPIRLAQAAIDSARRLGEPSVLLGALYTGMSAMMDIVDPEVRLRLNLEVEQLAQGAGDAERLLRTQARLVFDYMELADFASADARIEAFSRLAERARASRYRWRAPLFRSMRALIHGRFADAASFFAEAERLAIAARDPQAERTLVFHREGMQRAAEQHVAMVQHEPECRRMRLDLYSGPHWQNGGSAFTWSRIEDRNKTLMYLSLIPDGDWPLVSNPPAFAHLGEPLALMGTPEAARRAYELLLPARRRCISWGWTKFIWEGPAERVLGLLAARIGELTVAAEHFEAALAQLEALAATPYLARTRYEYARLLAAAPELAGHARAAELFEQARGGAEQLGMAGLSRLIQEHAGKPSTTPAPAAPSGPAEGSPNSRPPVALDSEALPFELLAEGEYWSVRYGALAFRLKDSLGLRYLARLVGDPGRPIHVLELSGQTPEPGSAIDAGDFGQLIDEHAKSEYVTRVAELRQELAEAEDNADLGRAAPLREELEFISAELVRGVGLGGRTRRGGSATERARSAVQRRIRNAVERIGQHSPELAGFLQRTVKTGSHCVFMPRAAGPH